MSKLTSPVTLNTAFSSYTIDEFLGEGGAGRVYGGLDSDRTPIALKVLPPDKASVEKRRRFKNEIAFGMQNKHENIVTVLDYGIANEHKVVGPFYVMRRFEGNLRNLMVKGIAPDAVLPIFSQILDGVEAAHLQLVFHRDIKPENILCNRDRKLALADFGIAHFSEELIATSVETSPNQRLANFQYAAPEQRTPGKSVGAPADIYALGLILNEMFTSIVPHGTSYRLIGSISKDFAFLDGVVAQAIRQAPDERPQSIAVLKVLIARYQSDAISFQKLSEIKKTVIKIGEIDEPLAHEPPQLIAADWNTGTLRLTLDRPVNQKWISALHSMSNYASAFGAEPRMFRFHGSEATVSGIQEHQVQPAINHFKNWLGNATRTLNQNLMRQVHEEAQERRRQLESAKATEEQRQRVNAMIRV
jgi:serine/threonine protein kinase